MPIKYADYPANWFTEIRPRILERAGNCCEACGVPNHAMIWRKRWPDRRYFGWVQLEAGAVVVRPECRQAFLDEAAAEIRQKRVKLAIAHLDHDTTRNDDDNLRAMCQWCHLRHDRRDNWRRRKYGRAVVSGQARGLDFSTDVNAPTQAPAVVAVPQLVPAS